MKSVVLDNGTELPADIVIVGAGVVPATSFVKGVTKAPDGSIVTDAFLRAGPGLYAAGDIARFPFWLTGERIRMEHWQIAQQTGRLAGKNIAGKSVTFQVRAVGRARPDAAQTTPFFWTMQWGKKINYCGHASSYDSISYEGSLEVGPGREIGS